MTSAEYVLSPGDERLSELLSHLRGHASALEMSDAWPREQLHLCARYGVFRWFFTETWGGLDWNESNITHGYVRLSSACLTTTFVITQHMAAALRIAACDNRELQTRLLPDLAAGRRYATVGISHLSTSRQHLRQPVMRAAETATGYRLDGYSPWVTGAAFAHLVVLGATLDNGQQILVAVSTDSPGVSRPPAEPLVGLSASQTGRLICEGVEVPREALIAGPCESVMKQGHRAGTGGLPTSALAVGLTLSAVEYLEEEASQRAELLEPTRALRAAWERLFADLLQVAGGEPVCSNEELRVRSNSLVLRATQAALMAAKGAGYVRGHPVGRWCREALFFLVWSCPQPVAAANLCEFAAIID